MRKHKKNNKTSLDSFVIKPLSAIKRSFRSKFEFNPTEFLTGDRNDSNREYLNSDNISILLSPPSLILHDSYLFNKNDNPSCLEDSFTINEEVSLEEGREKRNDKSR
nr:8656_t:CDS:1 [Entrophospora candida]CAG8491639.1 15220_t:CDS:1 [Entrophospora candida]